MSERTYHVHVYRVVEMSELTVVAESEYEARKFSLDLVKDGSATMKSADCSFIALVFDEIPEVKY